MQTSWQAILRRNAILSALPRLTAEPFYLVGGAVRDVLRGETTIKDWDIAIPRDALAVAKRYADAIGGTYIPLHDVQPTARVVQAGRQYDIIQYRAETLEEDLRQRDFTINAMAVDLRMLLIGADVDVIDPLGGLNDLNARQLRPCDPGAFRADPLRALRLYRFAATFGYGPTAEAEEMAAAVAPALRDVAPERIIDELARLCAAPGAASALAGMVRSGLWEAIVPEAAAGRGMAQGRNHHLDVFDHDTAAALASAEFLDALDAWAAPYAGDLHAWLDMPLAGERTRRWIVPLAALLHDAAKPTVRAIKPDGAPGFPWHEQAGGLLAGQIADRLRLSHAERNLLVATIRQHGRPNDLQHRGPDDPLRLMAVLGEHAPGAILVAMADRQSAQGPNRPPEKVAADVAFLQGLMRDYFGQYAPLLATPPLLSGDNLIATLGLRPGRQIGQLLLRLRWRQLRGRISSRDDALRVAAGLVRAS